MPASERTYDLVLLGATGFTGRLVARHLAGRLQDTPTRWGVAGRSRDRLERLADGLAGAPGVEVADVRGLPSLLELAGRTRVLASTVGPFARHGEPVVQACVRRSTDYCDVAGEPVFVDLVRDRYGTDAADRGVRLVTCCGFEAVPADLGAQLAVEQLPADAALTVRGYVHARGGLSGGTLRTALEAVTGEWRSRPAADADPAPAGDRTVGSTPVRIHRVPELGAWGVPLPTVDAAVVRRSAARLTAYGPAFRYGHFAEMSRLREVAGGVATVGLVVAATRFGPTRRLLRRRLPASGEGPPPQRREHGRFRVTLLGRGGGSRTTVRVAGGDPGYEATAVMLGEAALALADDDLPDVTGVLTPAVALGRPYRRRLVDQGIAFDILGAR